MLLCALHRLNEEQTRSLNVQFLDAMIDEIHRFLIEGNVIIHCLAGAHRSPFITGCYLSKYGLEATKGKPPEQIYKHLKQKRSIVQELGYDRQLEMYQKYLKDPNLYRIVYNK